MDEVTEVTCKWAAALEKAMKDGTMADYSAMGLLASFLADVEEAKPKTSSFDEREQRLLNAMDQLRATIDREHDSADKLTFAAGLSEDLSKYIEDLRKEG